MSYPVPKINEIWCWWWSKDKNIYTTIKFKTIKRYTNHLSACGVIIDSTFVSHPTGSTHGAWTFSETFSQHWELYKSKSIYDDLKELFTNE